MNDSSEESRFNSKILVVLFIIFALIVAYINISWRNDRIEETNERATQTQEALPTPTDVGAVPIGFAEIATWSVNA